ESGLQMANGAAGFRNRIAERMQEAVDNADVEQFPKSFTRTNVDGVDDCRVVNLIDVIFVFEYPRQLQQGTLLENQPAGGDTHERDYHRQQCQQPFLANLFG